MPSDQSRADDVAKEAARQQRISDLIAIIAPELSESLAGLPLDVIAQIAMLSIAKSVSAIAHPPPGSTQIIKFDDFIQRFTQSEYTLLLQKRAQGVTGGNTDLAKMWDIAAARGLVDLTNPATNAFKAGLVSNVILTPARADEIFQV